MIVFRVNCVFIVLVIFTIVFADGLNKIKEKTEKIDYNRYLLVATSDGLSFNLSIYDFVNQTFVIESADLLTELGLMNNSIVYAVYNSIEHQFYLIGPVSPYNYSVITFNALTIKMVSSSGTLPFNLNNFQNGDQVTFDYISNSIVIMDATTEDFSSINIITIQVNNSYATNVYKLPFNAKTTAILPTSFTAGQYDGDVVWIHAAEAGHEKSVISREYYIGYEFSSHKTVTGSKLNLPHWSATIAFAQPYPGDTDYLIGIGILDSENYNHTFAALVDPINGNLTDLLYFPPQQYVISSLIMYAESATNVYWVTGNFLSDEYNILSVNIQNSSYIQIVPPPGLIEFQTLLSFGFVNHL